jgi:hypothetical protein
LFFFVHSKIRQGRKKKRQKVYQQNVATSILPRKKVKNISEFIVSNMCTKNLFTKKKSWEKSCVLCLRIESFKSFRCSSCVAWCGRKKEMRNRIGSSALVNLGWGIFARFGYKSNSGREKKKKRLLYYTVWEKTYGKETLDARSYVLFAFFVIQHRKSVILSVLFSLR